MGACVRCGNPTIRAHLFPRSFSHRIRGAEKNISLMHKGRLKIRSVQSLGFDDDILCAACDGKIGDLDKYALEFCRKVKGIRSIVYPHFFIRDVKTDMLVRFAASVVWRCAISSNPDMREVSLGPETSAFADVVFDSSTSPISYPKVALVRYESRTFADVEHFAMVPTATDAMGARFYCFSLGGFRFAVMLDRADWPKNLPPPPINGQSFVGGIFVSLDDSTEYQQMRQIVARVARSRRGTQR
jgi:hypothetical protein